MSPSHRTTSSASLFEQIALGAAVLGAIVLLSFPAVRGASETFGWLPFWLLALPLCAWAVARALRGHGSARALRRPVRGARPSVGRGARVRRTATPQALRRAA
jgi:hypothetical protein